MAPIHIAFASAMRSPSPAGVLSEVSDRTEHTYEIYDGSLI